MTWVSYIPFSGVGLFRRGKGTLSTHGSLALDETKPSVPWSAVRSHIVEKAGVLLERQVARKGDYDIGIPLCILSGGCVSAWIRHSFYTRIAPSRRDEAISPLESSPLSHCKKAGVLLQGQGARKGDYDIGIP